jgi:arylsulfatase A-like enzyme
MKYKPNVVLVFADQWRAQATGYTGDVNVKTPHLDALSKESLNFTHAVSNCPVCSPFRGSLMTGQYPLTHGVFVNDVQLNTEAASLGKIFSEAGYDTAYIGKWHLDGNGRSSYIPPERRQGFSYWKALECTHDYNHSAYYAGVGGEQRHWEEYDAFAQTQDALQYIQTCETDKPFLLVLSWGPPHNPYETAPQVYRDLYVPEDIVLRPNVPASMAEEARRWLAGYYAHCTALDSCVGQIGDLLRSRGLENDTIFLFTSDHGDMLGSQGEQRKQRPWDESVRIPFLLHCPGASGREPGPCEAPVSAPDIMPTLLGLCGIAIPEAVEGLDFSGYVRGGPDPTDAAALLLCPHPFGEWTTARHAGRAYRGLRTRRHTYVRDLNGPWLLYDNSEDPFQQRNLVQEPGQASLIRSLEEQLRHKRSLLADDFLPGMEYIRRWGYNVDESGTVPYKN